MDNAGGILYAVLIALLAASAFFSSAGTAVSTVSKLRLRKRVEENGMKAAAALWAVDHCDRVQFSILIGSTLAKIAASAAAAITATARFGVTGGVIAASAAALLLLIFGEILPKTYAGDNGEQVLLAVARPLRVAIVLLTPLSLLLAGIRKLLYRMLPQPGKSPTVTEEELIDMIGSIGEEGVLEEQERELVQSALEFDETAVHEILTPRVNIAALNIDADPEEVRQTVIEEGYARIPVYEETIDHIVGVLYSREYLNALAGGEQPELRGMLNKPLFVHRQMKLSRLLALFQARKMNIAVVTDDYGGTQGIVTMEDVLEELVGDLYDEDDEIPAGLIRLDAATVEVEGDYSLEKTLEALGADRDAFDFDYATVNGWALHLLGHVPKVGESCRKGEFVLVVLEMDGHRIKRLRIARRPAVRFQPKKEGSR